MSITIKTLPILFFDDSDQLKVFLEKKNKIQNFKIEDLREVTINSDGRTTPIDNEFSIISIKINNVNYPVIIRKENLVHLIPIIEKVKQFEGYQMMATKNFLISRAPFFKKEYFTITDGLALDSYLGKVRNSMSHHFEFSFRTYKGIDAKFIEKIQIDFKINDYRNQYKFQDKVQNAIHRQINLGYQKLLKEKRLFDPETPKVDSNSRTKKVITEIFKDMDKKGWAYAFTSEQDYNLFTDLLTNFFEYKDYSIPETPIQLKKGCKTKIGKALGQIHKELSNKNKLTTDTDYFNLVRVLSHFESEKENDLYKDLTR